MRVVATFHQPSSVSHSVKCFLSSNPDLEFVVLAKINRLEVYSLRPEGLRAECALDIWGRVVSLKVLPIQGSHRANLLVLTDHPDPRLVCVAYTEQEGVGRLVSKAHVALHDKYSRPTEFVTDVFVHPDRELAVVSCYTGKLKVVVFKKGSEVEKQFDVLLPELNVLALCLLPFEEEAILTIAILHIDYQQRYQLIARDLDVQNHTLSPALSTWLPNTIISSSSIPTTDTPMSLIPISPQPPSDDIDDDADEDTGGVLVVGGRKILYFALATEAKREKYRDKQLRLEKRKNSQGEEDKRKAVDKERSREGRKVKAKAGVKWPWSEVTAWGSLDDLGRRFILGDAYGRLAMLHLSDASELLLIPLGEASPPTCLTYLSAQILYLGSHFGDSQLVRISTTPVTALSADTLPIPSTISTVSVSSLIPSEKGKEILDVDLGDRSAGKVVKCKGSYVEVVDNFENIAPVMDAVLADIDGSGQPQIVTCSGGRNTGSLRVVRTGADFQEIATINGLSNITNIWPIKTFCQSSTHSQLVLSTPHETLVFRFEEDGESVNHLDTPAAGFATELPSLAVSNIMKRTVSNGVSSYDDSPFVVQVTPIGIRLLEYDHALRTFTSVGAGWSVDQESDHSWKNREIVAASINGSQILLGLRGGRLALVNLKEQTKFQVLRYMDFGPSNEISAVTCTPLDSSKFFATYFAVSFWGSNNVTVLALEKGEIKTVCPPTPLPALARSLLLFNFGSGRAAKDAEYHPHLLAGLADGSVVSFSFKNKELREKKIASLGTAPVFLSPCLVDGRRTVLASGNRASILYWDKQRLQQSPVMLRDIITGATLNTSAFSNALILATSSGISIGRVRGVDKMQIRSIGLGSDNPRRIAYHPGLKMFGVACVHSGAPRIGDAEVSQSSFKLIDDVSLEPMGQFVCEPDEEITAVHALTDLNVGNRAVAFCVATVRDQLEGAEPTEGRLLIFALDQDGGVASPRATPRLVASTPTAGCTYALTIVHGMIAAAVNTSVRLYALADSEPVLSEVAVWDHNYFVTSLVSRGDNLIIGDAISSVSIVEVVGVQMRPVARDYGPLWPVAIEAIGENSVIGANSDCNLFTFTVQPSGIRAVLERDGNYHLGDVVNKFIPGGISFPDASQGRLLQPEQLFFTSAGRIGVVLDVDEDISLHMTAVQRNLAKVIVGPGDVHHAKWRAPANSKGRTDAEPSFGFLDGDFLEQFLSVTDPRKVLEGDIEAERVGLSQSKVVEILERLQSLH